MVNIRKIGLMLFASTIIVRGMAQETTLQAAEDKTGFMRSEGKIYVVVAVTLIILAGLILYVARLDRKITRLEKGENN